MSVKFLLLLCKSANPSDVCASPDCEKGPTITKAPIKITSSRIANFVRWRGLLLRTKATDASVAPAATIPMITTRIGDSSSWA